MCERQFQSKIVLEVERDIVNNADIYQLPLSSGELKEEHKRGKAYYWIMVSSNSFHHCGEGIGEELCYGRGAEADQKAEKLGRNQKYL